MTYARELLDTDPVAFRKFAKVMGIAHYRKDVPQSVWAAAKLVGTMAEDCGPCTSVGDDHVRACRCASHGAPSDSRA